MAAIVIHAQWCTANRTHTGISVNMASVLDQCWTAGPSQL